MKVLPLAQNTNREAIRDKILYVILLFAILLITSSVLLSYISLSHQDKIVIDFGLSAISLFGVLITVFVGTNLLSKEIDRKTIYLLLTRPIKRSEFILGKYLGLSLTIFIIVLFMSLAFYLVVWLTVRNNAMDYILTILPATVKALICIYVELLLLIAVAIFFSSFSSSIMSAIYTLGIYVIGHMTQDILSFGKMTESPLMIALTQALFYILPDLERINLKNYVFSGNMPEFSLFLGSVSYGLLYSVILLILSTIIFEKREF